jgi:sugar/nucleoside kinase (ribokinase family)
MRKVLVVGDANVDIIVLLPRLSGDERRKVEFSAPSIQGGGTSANTAVALSRLGIPVAFLGSIGDDQYGHYILKDFADEGVDTSALIVEPKLNTVGVFAFVDETGERYLWGWPRVDQAFKAIDEAKVDFGSVREASWVHSSGMSLVHDSTARYAIIDIFKAARGAGIPTSFDLNLRLGGGKMEPSYGMVIAEILELSDYVLGSGPDEFEYLGDHGWEGNARSLVREGRTVVVRLGGKGAMGISSRDECREGAFPVKVTDTVGAGDVFNAGFISATLRGFPLRDAVRMGNAVSGYKVSRQGARNSPRANELEAFLGQFSS